MARYAIGDIHGCYDEFMSLLQEINFNSGKDTLYLLGDLINRGPKSIEVLEWCIKHSNSIIAVLGNHEIYFLLRYNGVIPSKGDIDFLDPIFATRRIRLYVDYIRSLPCVYYDSNAIFVHSGLYPKQNLVRILEANHIIAKQLQSKGYSSFLEHFYKSFILVYPENGSKLAQALFLLKSSTQMRYILSSNHNLNFSYKLGIEGKPDYLKPWFELEFDDTIVSKKIYFGHWAALGLYRYNNIICIDSGCVWGNKLTAVDLDTGDTFQVQANLNYIGK